MELGLRKDLFPDAMGPCTPPTQAWQVGGSWDPHFPLTMQVSQQPHSHPQYPQCCLSSSLALGRAYQKALGLVLGCSCPAAAPRPSRFRGAPAPRRLARARHSSALPCLPFRHHHSGICGF